MASEAVQGAAMLLGQAWHNAVTPFAIFGDQWLLNVLFIFFLAITVYNLFVLSPKQ